MTKNYDMVDFFWSIRGDLKISHDGDILSTESDILRSIVQEIRTRIQSDQGEWVLYPDVGADLSKFVGNPNNKMNAENIKASVIAALAKHGLALTSDIKITYLPMDIDKLMIRIALSVLPSAQNRGAENLVLAISYSYSENNISIHR